MNSNTVIELPDIVVTPLDLGIVQREIFELDKKLNAAKGILPYISNELNTILRVSKVNPLVAEDRDRLIKQLQFVRRTAPTVQISFASQPSKTSLRPIVGWFRKNGHPNTLINIGIQESIAGGCVVRTSKKEFDFSLQKLFRENQSNLVSMLS